VRICVIFATVRDSFEAATVRSEFPVPLSPVCNSNGGVFMTKAKLIVDRQWAKTGDER
jgi:hypothetical protein